MAVEGVEAEVVVEGVVVLERSPWSCGADIIWETTTLIPHDAHGIVLKKSYCSKTVKLWHRSYLGASTMLSADFFSFSGETSTQRTWL